MRFDNIFFSRWMQATSTGSLGNHRHLLSMFSSGLENKFTHQQWYVSKYSVTREIIYHGTANESLI